MPRTDGASHRILASSPSRIVFELCCCLQLKCKNVKRCCNASLEEGFGENAPFDNGLVAGRHGQFGPPSELFFRRIALEM